MIREEEVYKIGMLTKTHGVSGELSLSFTDDVFDRVDADYLVCKMDGILVPFFMEEYRFKNDTTALVKFADIDTEEQARKMVGVEVFFPKALATQTEDNTYSWSYFVGFKAFDEQYGALGTIVGIDESTVNVLFEIRTPQGNELLVPAHEEFIVGLDHEREEIHFCLPEGLLTLGQLED